MPIRSKLMFGLLVFSTIPLIVLGWFVSSQVNKARHSAVMQIQKAQQQSVKEMRNLSRRAAKYKAEEIAAVISAFLAENPAADPSELRHVRPVREALAQQSTIGCITTVELLLDNRPLTVLGPVRAAPLRQEPAINELPELAKASLEEPAQLAEVREHPYTYIANVPGSSLKVATTVEDMGIDKTLDHVAQAIGGVGDATEAETNRVMDNLRLMLVIGVTALVVGVTVAGGEIARTITRPISKLTVAANEIQQGKRDVDLKVGGGREIRLLAGAFERATGELQDYAASLERKNAELEDAWRVEERAKQELQEAQDEMIQMEKMSSLGRLVAGVAHEINTPTGAIYNVTGEASESLEGLFGGLYRLRGMTPEEFDRFRHFLDVAVARRLTPERVSRKVKRQLRSRLTGAGIERPQKYVELLAKCHMADLSESLEMCQLLESHGVVDVFTALVEIHAGMKISRTSAERISKIVRALRFYSHGGGQATAVPTNVNNTVHDALVILHNRVKQRAEVKLDLDEDLPDVSCTDGLTQVWVNLLTNACDAIEEGEPAGGGEIRIRTFCSDGTVHVCVADNGAPVPPDVAHKIFDPFFSTKPPGKGAGLGLAVVMGTVKRNGGSIQLHPGGEFKEFEVTLPVGKTDSNNGIG
ncbi:MAG: sensor histidine kinase [Planctomycetota bacterium]